MNVINVFIGTSNGGSLANHFYIGDPADIELNIDRQFDEDLEDVPSFIEALGYSVGQSDEAAFWKWHDGDYMTKVKALPGWQMTRVYNCNAHLMM